MSTRQKILTIGHISDNFTGARLTRHLTGNQRVSLLEDIRRDMAKVQRYEYPARLRRVIEVTEQKKG